MNKRVAFLTTIFPMKIQFLYDFFDSLEKQTYQKFDIIVINDAYENFEAIKNNYRNLDIIELKYSNTIAKNREYGINYVIDNNYNILIFGDSDDHFSNNRVEKCIELLELNDIVVNDLSLFTGNKIYEEKYISNRIQNNTLIQYDFIKDKNIFGLSNTALNVKIMSNIIFDEKLVAVDWFLYKKLLKSGNKAIFTNDVETFYRQYENNTIGLSNDEKSYPLWWEDIKNTEGNK